MGALPAAQVRDFIGQGIPKLVERCLQAAGLPLACARLEPALRSFGAHYARVNGTMSRPFEGVPEGLARLRAAGLKLACVTNKAAAFTRPLLQRTGLARFFDEVVSADQVGARKPRPEPFLHACDALGVMPPQAAVVGDSENDAAAARAAGCPVILVSYGYNEGRDVRLLACDGLADTFEDAVRLCLS